MPTRPLTHAERQRTRQGSDQRYNAERRAVHGPDPRSTARWRRLRAQVLSEEPLCADPYGLHQSEARVEAATDVDHIMGLHERPDLMFDRSNLHGLCGRCHQRKSQDERALRPAEVWLITGPPGSGKSTYVRQHQKKHDLVLDLDRLLAALSSRDWDGYREWLPETGRLLPYALGAYEGVIERYCQVPLRGANVWVIATLAHAMRRKQVQQQLHARCVVLAVPTEECLRRIGTDPQRHKDVERWRPLVERWWQRYRPNEGESVVCP